MRSGLNRLREAIEPMRQHFTKVDGGKCLVIWGGSKNLLLWHLLHLRDSLRTSKAVFLGAISAPLAMVFQGPLGQPVGNRKILGALLSPGLPLGFVMMTDAFFEVVLSRTRRQLPAIDNVKQKNEQKCAVGAPHGKSGLNANLRMMRKLASPDRSTDIFVENTIQTRVQLRCVVRLVSWSRSDSARVHSLLTVDIHHPMRLLISMVARPHHCAHCRMHKAHFVSFFFKHFESIRMHIAQHWQVVEAWC